MSRRVVHVLLPAVVGLLVTLTGCGAGQVTQTARQVSGVNGYSGEVGSILVRDGSIAFAGQANTGSVYRMGQTAPLDMTLVNNGATADKLISVSSPIAAGGQVQGDATIAGGRAVQVGNGEARTESSALSDRTINVTLTGLKQDIKPGLNYPVVLTFEKAGVLTAKLPVGDPTGPLAERK